MSPVLEQTRHGPWAPLPPLLPPIGERPAPVGEGPPPRSGGGRRPGLFRRHRALTIVLSVLAVLVLVVAGGLFYQWRYAGPRQVSGSSALQRFRAGARGPVAEPGALRPPAGVYAYTGTAHEQLSFPPLSHNEGPHVPGTVTYQKDGCWTFRLDYSTLHWQSTTFCPRDNDLVESARAGWYRWYVGALPVSDTATFTCVEMIVPVVLSPGQGFAFGCRGTNSPINTGTVLMEGTNSYLGTGTVRVGGTSVTTLHFREVAQIRGGQTGTSTADTWVSAADGLPVKGTWSTTVRSPSPFGTSTLTGRGSFTLSSLQPRR